MGCADEVPQMRLFSFGQMDQLSIPASLLLNANSCRSEAWPKTASLRKDPYSSTGIRRAPSMQSRVEASLTHPSSTEHTNDKVTLCTRKQNQVTMGHGSLLNLRGN